MNNYNYQTIEHDDDMNDFNVEGNNYDHIGIESRVDDDTTIESLNVSNTDDNARSINVNKDENENNENKNITDDRCNIYVKENFAITMAYLSVGLVGSIMITPLNIYIVRKLNAEPPIQNTIYILQSIPWSLKLVFGFISDAFPIYGMQRKPYLTIGALLYSIAFISYAIIGIDNLTMLSICVFMGTLGLIQMDVMADTMSVQRSKFESEDQRGQMQSTFYSIRFLGGLIGAIIGASICNIETWGWGLSFHQVSFLVGLIPFVLVIPWLYRCDIN